MARSSRQLIEPTYRKTTLRNGLRVVTESLPSVRSVSLGVWVNTGSRHETRDETGVSHLVEHMVFKGTRDRNAKQIATSLESVGGSLNAFTSREQTCFTARILDQHLPLAVDVLSDITCRATFTPTNLKREKLVVCEEISESLENPSDYIHDLFASTFWGDHALGRPILGDIDGILAMSRRTIGKYVGQQYRSGAIVVAASGSVSHDKLVRLVRRHFSFPTGKTRCANGVAAPGKRRVAALPKDIAQIHVSLGFPGLPYQHPDKIALLALTSYLGSGMSSVLFQKVREQKGLAYTIFSYHDSYTDAGMFGTYFATDKKNFANALSITLAVLRRVSRKKISADRLDQVKRQLQGQLMLSMESTAARMSRLGRIEQMLGRHVSLEHTMNQIDKVTPSDITRLAREVFDERRLVVATLGPTDEKTIRNTI